MTAARYCVGFAFDAGLERVLLIHKRTPAWQAGRLNGIGGKLDPDELDALGAMVREFEEETTIVTTGEDWRHFATLRKPDGEVEFFSAVLPAVDLAWHHGLAPEAETLVVARVDEIHGLAALGLTIASLAFLVPLAALQWRRDHAPEFAILVKRP